MNANLKRPGRDRSASGPAADDRPLTKTEKRALAKARKAKALAAKRRRQAILGALAGVAVVGVIVAAFALFGRSDQSGGGGAGAQASGTPDATTPTAQPFPPLPEGADPALGQKPTTAAGTGELTKLTVTPLIEGKGPATAAGQTITVNYVGVSYRTGQEFDASWNSARPFTFQLGAGNVIPGWDQGLVGVKVGSRVQLDIPANLAYGDNPGSGQPGGPLRFIVDVLDAR